MRFDTFAGCLLLVVVYFAPAPAAPQEEIRGAFGLRFGEALPDSAFLPDAYSAAVPSFPAAVRDSVAPGWPAGVAGSWAMVRPPEPAQALADGVPEYMVQLDTVGGWSILRVVAAVSAEPNAARRRVYAIAGALARKYQVVEQDSMRAMFRFRSGAGYMELHATESGILLDYYGAAYLAWFSREMAGFRKAEAGAARGLMSQF